MDKGCILINKNCTAELITIDEFNSKFKKIKNKGLSEFVLIPVTRLSEAYIAIPTVSLPDDFKPMKIEYEFGIMSVIGRYNIWEDTNQNTKKYFRSKYKIECNTLYDLYIFAFSLKKLEAFNVLNNMNEIERNPYTVYLASTVHIPYIFCIYSLGVEYKGETIKTKEVKGIEHALEIISGIIGVKSIITPCVYKFWIDDKRRCNYTPVSNHSKMIGKINKISDFCVMSNQCINYDAYSFINSRDEALLRLTSCCGELLLVNYTLMCDEDSIPLDGPINVTDMLKYPDMVSVYRIERYKLYTLSDCVEALTFAEDLLQMMDVAKKLIGGDESMSESMIEIRLEEQDSYNKNGTPESLSYTITKESLDFGEITNVISDFMHRLDVFLDNQIPF